MASRMRLRAFRFRLRTSFYAVAFFACKLYINKIRDLRCTKHVAYIEIRDYIIINISSSNFDSDPTYVELEMEARKLYRHLLVNHPDQERMFKLISDEFIRLKK